MQIFDRGIPGRVPETTGPGKFELMHAWVDPVTQGRMFSIRFYALGADGQPVGGEVLRTFDAAEFATFMTSPHAPREVRWLGQILAACATEVEYHDRNDA
jgi:hypothetical protein